MTLLRPAWSSASFLFYAGAFVSLAATLVLLATLSEGSKAELTGWSALAAAVAAALAVALAHAGRGLLAGLAAFLGVLFFGGFAAALVGWIGLGTGESGGFLPRSFEPGLYLTELAVVVAGLAALRRFGLPLLVLPVAAALLYALVDAGTALFGGDSGGVPSLFAALGGAALLVAGIRADRSEREPLGFWLHALAGVALGEALLYLASHGELGWAAAAVGSVAYVEAARRLARSSWAVLGAVGVVIVSTHWIEQGLGVPVPVPFLGQLGDGAAEPWQIALAYVGVGIALVLLGLLARRPRRALVRL